MITKAQKDNLFLLVKSLTKSEKRQFKLYVGRLGVNTDSKFLNLFNILDKASVYDEVAILKTGIVKKQQLANVKAHLYKQILISLKYSKSTDHWLPIKGKVVAGCDIVGEMAFRNVDTFGYQEQQFHQRTQTDLQLFAILIVFFKRAFESWFKFKEQPTWVQA